MTRRLLNLLTALSLLLCVVACVLCVRSYWRSENVGIERIAAGGDATEVSALYLHSGAGSVEVGRWRARFFKPADRAVVEAQAQGGWRWFHRDWSFGAYSGGMRTPTLAERLGFGYRSERANVADEDTNRIVQSRENGAATVPYWLPALATAALPLAGAARRLGRLPLRRRRGPGRCRACGYDLRATPDRCPECGTAA